MYDRLKKVNDQGMSRMLKVKIDFSKWKKNNSNENGVHSKLNSVKGIKNAKTYVTCPKAAKAL